MQFEGKLVGPWAAEAEKAWRQLPWPGGSIEVDVCGVTAVDVAGERLFERMHQQGAHFVARGVEMRALIEGIAATSIAK